jgi:chromosome segregation ATPase
MKKYFFGLLLTGIAAFFFWPVGQDSGIYKYRQSVINRATLIGKSKDECKEELELKKEQVAAYEKAIAEFDADFERMNAEIPVCPRTGQKSTLRITHDPRPELRAKIETLQEEIKVLESKVSGS